MQRNSNKAEDPSQGLIKKPKKSNFFVRTAKEIADALYHRKPTPAEQQKMLDQEVKKWEEEQSELNIGHKKI